MFHDGKDFDVFKYVACLLTCIKKYSDIFRLRIQNQILL